MTGQHFIYRVFNAAGDVIYVGRTIYPLRRPQQHAKSHWFAEAAEWEFEERADWWDMVAAERRAIETEHPRYNITFRQVAA